MKCNNTIEIPGDGHRIKMELQHRDFPDAIDYWDGNWVTTHFWLDIPGQPTMFTYSLHLGDLLRFEQELALLLHEQEGQATLTMMEKFFCLEASVSRGGALHWSATTNIPTKQPSDGALLPILAFDFKADLSSLPTILEQVQAVLQQFPIKSPHI